jgi:hypothetical protein
LRRIPALPVALILFALLLAPALASLTSPLWCPPLCRWAAGRFFGAELRLSSARLDPFGLRLHARDGFVKVAGGAGMVTGTIDRLAVDLDIVPLLAEGRIGSVSLGLGTLRVEGAIAPASPPGPAAPGGAPGRPGKNGVRSSPPGRVDAPRRSLVIDRLDVSVGRGIFNYQRGDASGEVAFDLGFRGSYRDVRGFEELAEALLRDAVRGAAVGGLEGLLR